MEHGARLHSEWGASGRKRRRLCPGSVRMARAAPPSAPSEWALDGTAAHELIDYCFKNGIREAELGALSCPSSYGEHDEERCRAVQVMLDYVYGILDTFPDAIAHYELRVHLDSQAAPGEVFGTADVIIYIPSVDMLYVIDYKHGAGVPVEVEENEQLEQYIASACCDIYLAPVSDGTTIVGTIVQPRCDHVDGPVREWTVPWERFLTLLPAIEMEISVCQRSDAPLVPSYEACHWCPATTCPARYTQAMSVLPAMIAEVRTVAQVLPPVDTLTVQQLSDIAANADFLIDYLKDVKSALFGIAMGGNHVPDYKLVESITHRQWYGHEMAIATALMKQTGQDIDVIMPRKLIGIVDAEKLVKEAYKAGAPNTANKELVAAAKKWLASYTEKPPGKLVLVPVSDRREVKAPHIDMTKYVQLPDMRD